MEQERLLSDGDFDRSRASPPRSPARMGRASSTRPKLRGVAVSGFIVMLLLAGSLRFASPGSNARRGPVASDVGGLVATPLNPKRKPVRVKATIKTAAAGRPEATPKPVRVAPAGSTAISAYPLSCDASDACRRARDIAVSSWSKHPIPAPGRLRSDYAWSPFVPGRRWELSASPYTPERSQVVPQVVAAKDALPAIPRIIVQTWREERVGKVTWSALSSWTEVNSEYDYLYFTDAAALRYVEQWQPSTAPAERPTFTVPKSYARDAGKPGEFFGPCSQHKPRLQADVLLTQSEIARIKAAYSKLTNTASRADVFRAMVLYDVGGIYADVDTSPRMPVRNWLDPRATFVQGMEHNGHPHQWVMLSAPRHPFLAQLLRNAAEAVESGVLNSTRISETVYAIAGPPALRRAMSELLCSPTHQDLGASMQWWNEVGGGLAHVIVRKIEGIRQEWEGRGFKYWMSQRKSKSSG